MLGTAEFRRGRDNYVFSPWISRANHSEALPKGVNKHSQNRKERADDTDMETGKGLFRV